MHAVPLADSRVGQDSQSGVARLRHRRRAAASVGLAATLVSMIASSIPSYWSDEFAARSLSALAVGAAAAGLVVLVSQVTKMKRAVPAGTIFAILPRTTYVGIKARSFGVSAAFAVWATVIFIAAARSNSWRLRWWGPYAVITAAATYLFLYSGLLLAACLAFYS